MKKKILSLALAIITIGTLVIVPTQASATSWVDDISRNLYRNQAETIALCGISCVYPFGTTHRYACPNCDGTNYKVLSINNCVYDVFCADRNVYYEYRQCACGKRYKGEQFR